MYGVFVFFCRSHRREMKKKIVNRLIFSTIFPSSLKPGFHKRLTYASVPAACT